MSFKSTFWSSSMLSFKWVKLQTIGDFLLVRMLHPHLLSSEVGKVAPNEYKMMQTGAGNSRNSRRSVDVRHQWERLMISLHKDATNWQSGPDRTITGASKEFDCSVIQGTIWDLGFVFLLAHHTVGIMSNLLASDPSNATFRPVSIVLDNTSMMYGMHGPKRVPRA